MHRFKGVCAYISDHSPTFEQREDLEGKGYKIVQIHSPRKGRWKNADQLYSYMKSICNPDIIIMVLPSEGLGGSFLKLVHDIPVYQAEMRRDGLIWQWTGQWTRILGTHYLRQPESIPLRS